MQRKGMCYGKNYLLHGISLEGWSPVRVLRTAALYLSHGRATLLPASCCPCQEHMQSREASLRLEEARSGPAPSVLPRSHLCSERSESSPVRRRKDRNRKVLDVLDGGHYSGKATT